MPDNNAIARIKSEISLLSLAEKAGCQLKRLGSGEYQCRCPFPGHEDKTASCHINPEKNLFHCKGCGKGGSIIDWLMHSRELDEKGAISFLEEQFPQHLSVNGSHVKQEALASEIAQESTWEITDIIAQQLLKRVFEYFHRVVRNSADALGYLEKRGLVHAELLEEFQIGYADNSFLSRLPAGKEGREIKELLRKIGILTEKGNFLFNAMLVFPVFTEKGEIVNVYGRRIQERQNYPNHLYLPGRHRGLFNLKALQLSREIILCESIMDALSFWVHGFRNVTCSYGVNGFTDEMLQIFREYKTDKVFIAYDSDAAGNTAAEALAASLSTVGIESLRVRFPAGLDANEFIGRVKNPADNLRLLLQNAVSLSLPAKREKIFSDLSLSGRASDVLWEKKQGYYHFRIGQREYSFFGLDKNLSFEILKVRIRFSLGDKKYSDNGLDLYNHKSLKTLIRSASAKLEAEEQIIEKDLDKILPVLEEIQTEIIEEKLNTRKDKEILLSESQRQAALDYLKNPKLTENIINDIEKVGLVGENENALIGYLSALSRKDDKPLAVIVQSSSGAGKTTFMDAILSLMPDEDVIKFSALTDQSLYYMETSLKNKILAIVEEEGASRASYSLKLLQSEGKISIAVAGKDPESGKMVTQTYEVEGPVMIFLATTNCEIDEELKNRALIITINEDENQTRKILKLQREQETLDGLIHKSEKNLTIELHQNVQRMLRPVYVINPFSKDLTFMSKDHRARRDQKKYLTLIRIIAFLHQYQREIKTIAVRGQAGSPSGRFIEYIEVSLDDIELANKLAVKIFGVSLDDLSPQTRLFLEKLYDWVLSECKKQKIDLEDFRFTKREAATALSISISRAGVHLLRLETDDYVKKWFGKHGQTNVYSLLYRGEGRRDLRLVLGLADIEKLRKKYDK